MARDAHSPPLCLSPDKIDEVGNEHKHCRPCFSSNPRGIVISQSVWSPRLDVVQYRRAPKCPFHLPFGQSKIPAVPTALRMAISNQ
jgi:hypothetical protein